jgi:hypothetical protein
MEDKRMANINDSRHLVVSSCFFLAPGIYAFSNSLYPYGILSFITTVISVNHWRNPIMGLRRTADLITAKVSFAIYFVSGCFFVRDIQLLGWGIPGCAGIILFYFLSNKFSSSHPNIWVYFHMLFHLFVAGEMTLVLYSGVKSGAYKYFL